MSATARLVVLMSPAEKAALEAKASRAGTASVAELVRRAVAAYDTDAAGEEAELRGLLAAFHASRAETLRRLDAAERALDRTLAALDTRRPDAGRPDAGRPDAGRLNAGPPA